MERLTRHEEQIIEAYRLQPEEVRQGIDRILRLAEDATTQKRGRPRKTSRTQERTLDIAAVLRDRNGTPFVCWHKIIERTTER